MQYTDTNTSFRRTFRGLLQLLRPKQWIKNSFVLAPLVFSGLFLDINSVKQSLLATFLFCIASSAAYIVNDIRDVENDRRHSKKSKSRPIAAGLITVRQALYLLLLFYVSLIIASYYVPKVMMTIGVYILINIAYSFVLKYQPVIDIFTIAIGFVLRVLVGTVALSAPISGWMLVTTLCLSLYLAAIKRRQELRENGAGGRKVLKRYSIGLVDRYSEMSATCALMFYSMFVMSARPQLIITVPLVIFGLFRYWFVVEELAAGESPTDVVFSDWQLLLTILFWVGICCWSLWPV